VGTEKDPVKPDASADGSIRVVELNKDYVHEGKLIRVIRGLNLTIAARRSVSQGERHGKTTFCRYWARWTFPPGAKCCMDG
jgi:hypothetical protein